MSDVQAGVDYVAGNFSTGDVVNLSLGFPTSASGISNLEDSIVSAANSGLMFSIAAGNGSQNTDNISPARINNTNVWTVSAYRQGDEFAQTFDWNTPNCNGLQDPNVGSNFENPPVDFSGPGESILSLWRDNGTYTTCGTSMAAPHIAGLLLALGQEPNHNGFVSNDPDNTADEIVSSRPLAPSVTGTIQNNSPRLDWPAVTDAQSYDIHRKFEDGNWSVIDNTTNSYYVDTDIYSFDLEKVNQPPYDFSDTYAYRVRAVPAAGKDGPWSNLTYYVLDCTGMTCTQSVDK